MKIYIIYYLVEHVIQVKHKIHGGFKNTLQLKGELLRNAELRIYFIKTRMPF